MPVRSKRIGDTSALFHTKCRKIGIVSDHRMGLIIMYYTTEANQWKVLFVLSPAFSLYETVVPSRFSSFAQLSPRRFIHSFLLGVEF